MRLLVCAAALTFLCACGMYRHGPSPYRASVPSPPPGFSGKHIYQRDCAWCHGSEGEGTAAGPKLTGRSNGPALTDFMLRTGRMPLDDPHQRMTHRAPAYDSEDIRAIVRYVSSIGAEGEPIPRVHTSASLIGYGGRLYFDNCAACHASTGVGGALVEGAVPHVERRESGNVAPTLAFATPLEIAEATRTGPGAMPSFDRGVLSDRDVNAIVAYVSYLKDPKDRGGAPITRTGPVPEGAVAWLGLGALLVFTRWIGTRER